MIGYSSRQEDQERKNSQDVLQEIKAETGRRMIGYFHPVVPEELSYAMAGRVWNAPEEDSVWATRPEPHWGEHRKQIKGPRHRGCLV